MWNKIKEWLGAAAKKLWQIVAPAVKAAALEFVNNASVQASARAAVSAAASNGLFGNEAFDYAVKQFKSSSAIAGKSIALDLIETVVQNAYFEFKNSK